MTNRTRGRAAAPVVPLADKRQWSIPEFSELFGISVPTIYRYARNKHLKLMKSAGRTFISREEAERWQRRMEAHAEARLAALDGDGAGNDNDNAAHGTAA